MTRIKITKSAEQNSVRVSNTSVSADVPIDGQFHEIHDDLLPVLTDSSIEFEIEKRPVAKRSRTAAGGAARVGGRRRAATTKRIRKPRVKAAKAPEPAKPAESVTAATK